MKSLRTLYSLFIVAVVVWSCNLSDFQLDRLVQPDGLSPVVYRPFATGTYNVKDYAVFPGAGNAPVTLDSISFRQINYPFNGMTLNTKGTDSMVVIVKTVNETPMKYSYSLSFSGTTLRSSSIRKYLTPAVINAQGDVMETVSDSLEFRLTPKDVINLGTTGQVDLQITLYQPDKGTVIASVLKASRISFRIGFRAPLNLFDISL